MKYIEELSGGSVFSHENKRYVLTSDFKISKDVDKKKCIDLDNGFVYWFDSNTIVEYLDLYYRDLDGNILPLKTIAKK